MRQMELCEAQVGWRANAGRKPSPDSGEPHLTRAEVNPRHPLHITDRVRGDVPNLRQAEYRAAYFKVFREAKEEFGCRLIEFSVMSNHFHYIVEAGGKADLTRFMIGLKVRLAKAINKVAGPVGSVFADRYHRVDLTSMRQTWIALRYVLCNASKHGIRYAGRLDFFSSARWFDGWLDLKTPLESNPPVAEPRTYWLRSWMKHLGRIDPDSYRRN